jgi:hypothetical protein
LRLNQYGATAGGAVKKNRTFFFLAYEGLRQRVGTTLIGNVPTDSFRATVLAQSPVLAPILAAFPTGNRALSANVAQFVSKGSLSANEDSGLVRIDQRISDSTSFFARFNIDKVSLSSPSGALLDVAQTTASPLNGTINLSHVFRPTLFNVVQVGLNRIHTLSHTDSRLFDVSKVFNSVQIPGLTTLNQEADSVKSPTTYTLKDDLTWNRGSHTIKAGIEIKRVLYNYSQPSQNALVYATAAGFVANQLDQANFLGGVPMHGLRKTMDFGYIQDQWKIKKNLTLDIGMRYEFFSVFHEVYGRALPFDLKTCGGYCPQRSLFSYPQTKNFLPRAGFAWSPEALQGKTVIRSGFGMYKGEGQLGDLNAPSDNFAQRLSLSSAQFANLSYPPDSFYAAAGNQAVTPRALDRTRKDPTVLQWGFQLQTALPAGFILDTGYLGYHGYHQFYRSYVNLIDPASGVRQFSAFGPIDVKQTDGNNHFNGWQTSLRRQFRSGLSFSANYMWSHSINDGPQGGGEADYAENTACRSCEVASGDFDVRHTFSANAVYQLPFGKGRQFLTGGRIAQTVLGGWELTGLGSIRSGNPVNVIVSRSASSLPDGLSIQDGKVFQRPNYVGGISLVPANQSITNWINPLAFAVPANGTWGNAGRNLVRGPRFMQADIGLTKSFPVTDRIAVAFRAEAFNVFNRAQFGDPNGNFSSPSFGQITSTVNNGSVTGSGTPREFQFALRLKF